MSGRPRHGRSRDLLQFFGQAFDVIGAPEFGAALAGDGQDGGEIGGQTVELLYVDSEEVGRFSTRQGFHKWKVLPPLPPEVNLSEREIPCASGMLSV